MLTELAAAHGCFRLALILWPITTLRAAVQSPLFDTRLHIWRRRRSRTQTHTEASWLRVEIHAHSFIERFYKILVRVASACLPGQQLRSWLQKQGVTSVVNYSGTSASS